MWISCLEYESINNTKVVHNKLTVSLVSDQYV